MKAGKRLLKLRWGLNQIKYSVKNTKSNEAMVEVLVPINLQLVVLKYVKSTLNRTMVMIVVNYILSERPLLTHWATPYTFFEEGDFCRGSLKILFRNIF